MADEPKLRVENLTKRFGDLVAVDDISFEAPTGELTSLLGPSGCGKTTTLRCIAGLERPDEGQIYIDGELVADGDQNVVPANDRDLGMVFQSYAIWPHMNVARNVGYGLELRGMKKGERNERISEVLELVGLEGLEDKSVTELSGGQQQRVVLARSLAYEPELLLLDEPLANLDAKLRRQMQREMKRIQERADVTAIYVTHDQDEGMVLSDTMMVMQDGDIMGRGRPEFLFNQPDDKWVAQFLGRTNEFPASVSKSNGTYHVETEFGSYETHDIKEADDPTIFIRPNNIRILRESDDPSEAGIVISVSILERQFLGERTEYRVSPAESDKEFLVSSTTTALEYGTGDEMRCFLPAEYCRVL